MSTFREYKKNRPADPALAAQCKTEMQHELDREQLARMIDPDSWEFIDDFLRQVPEGHPSCDRMRERSLKKADAIIAAGWTPPLPTETLNPTLEN